MDEELAEEEEFAGHEEPVWRERANFMIHAKLPKKDRPKRFEQLWTRQLAEDRFEVCCIPFFVLGLALGDVVATSPMEDMKYVVDRVVARSGRHVYRVRFSPSFQPRDEAAAELEALGSLIEWSSRDLLAVDASDSERARVVADVLMKHEMEGHLTHQATTS